MRDHEFAYVRAALYDPSVLSRLPVPSSWFTSRRCQEAHRILRELDQGDGVDLLRFWEAWRRKGHTVADFMEAMDRTVVSAEVAAEGLREKAERRAMGRVFHEALKRAQDPLESLTDLRAWVLGELIRIGDDGTATTVVDVLEEVAERLQEIKRRGSPGLETGFVLLDRLIGGWEPGKLYSIGARPKSGKTALAMQTAVKALEQGARVYFASLEMGPVQLGVRLLAQTGRVDGNALRRAHLAEADEAKVTHAVERLRGFGDRFVVDTRAAIPWERLRASILQAHARDRVGLVVLDYLQLLRAQRERENRAAELEAIAYGLKELAKELRAPVVALSQLNREVDERRPPSSSKLKGSGGIEQAADVSILLWRPDLKEPRTIEVVVDLNRDGPTGKFRAAFRPEWTLFE